MTTFKPFLIISLILALFTNVVMAKNLAVNELDQAELEQTLAPIALYPDSLLTHILIAATYPLEVVQAQRFRDQHENLTNDELALRVANKSWDASVKALIAFPRVLSRMNNDLQWTQSLGDAFLTNEEQVLASIQILRRKAAQAGNLTNVENLKVIRQQKTIIIEAADPQVIYVPYYDSRYVYGDWAWYDHPPVYWAINHHNAHYYRSSYSPFYWHTGVHISFNFFFNAFHWHERHIVVTQVHNTRRHYSYGKLVNNHHARRWQHDPIHRRGVAYSTGHLKQRYSFNSHRANSHGASHQAVKARVTNHINNHSYKKVSERLHQAKSHHLKSTQSIVTNTAKQGLRTHQDSIKKKSHNFREQSYLAKKNSKHYQQFNDGKKRITSFTKNTKSVKVHKNKVKRDVKRELKRVNHSSKRERVVTTKHEKQRNREHRRY